MCNVHVYIYHHNKIVNLYFLDITSVVICDEIFLHFASFFFFFALLSLQIPSCLFLESDSLLSLTSHLFSTFFFLPSHFMKNEKNFSWFLMYIQGISLTVLVAKSLKEICPHLV